MSLQQEGTVGFWLLSPNDGWHSDSLKYDFPKVSFGDIAISVTKQANRKLVVTLSGPFEQPFNLSAKTPKPTLSPDKTPGVHVAVTWKFPSVKLYLGGKQVDEQKVHAH